MDEEKNEPLTIMADSLSTEALQGVIESFVLREGTDYGDVSYSLAQKVAHVREQLERGEATLSFDPDTSTVSIVMHRELRTDRRE